jgi:hypothetical protein
MSQNIAALGLAVSGEGWIIQPDDEVDDVGPCARERPWERLSRCRGVEPDGQRRMRPINRVSPRRRSAAEPLVEPGAAASSLLLRARVEQLAGGVEEHPRIAERVLAQCMHQARGHQRRITGGAQAVGQALGELGRRVRLQNQARAQAAAERDELLAAQLRTSPTSTVSSANSSAWRLPRGRPCRARPRPRQGPAARPGHLLLGRLQAQRDRRRQDRRRLLSRCFSLVMTDGRVTAAAWLCNATMQADSRLGALADHEPCEQTMLARAASEVQARTWAAVGFGIGSYPMAADRRSGG